MFYHTAAPPTADELTSVTTTENANRSENMVYMDYQDAISALPNPAKGDGIKSEASDTYENIDTDRENITTEDGRLYDLLLTGYLNPSEGTYTELTVNQPK